MTRRPGGVAVIALREQVEIIGSCDVSLHTLWRAVGEPRGHDPHSWAERADALIAGYAHYVTRIDPRPADPVLWVFDGIDGDPWRVGDLMGRGEIAQIYANYLDSISRDDSDTPPWSN
jgi:hypothetical protein